MSEWSSFPIQRIRQHCGFAVRKIFACCLWRIHKVHNLEKRVAVSNGDSSDDPNLPKETLQIVIGSMSSLTQKALGITEQCFKTVVHMLLDMAMEKRKTSLISRKV